MAIGYSKFASASITGLATHIAGQFDYVDALHLRMDDPKVEGIMPYISEAFLQKMTFQKRELRNVMINALANPPYTPSTPSYTKHRTSGSCKYGAYTRKFLEDNFANPTHPGQIEQIWDKNVTSAVRKHLEEEMEKDPSFEATLRKQLKQFMMVEINSLNPRKFKNAPKRLARMDLKALTETLVGLRADGSDTVCSSDLSPASTDLDFGRDKSKQKLTVQNIAKEDEEKKKLEQEKEQKKLNLQQQDEKITKNYVSGLYKEIIEKENEVTKPTKVSKPSKVTKLRRHRQKVKPATSEMRNHLRNRQKVKPATSEMRNHLRQQAEEEDIETCETHPKVQLQQQLAQNVEAYLREKIENSCWKADCVVKDWEMYQDYPQHLLKKKGKDLLQLLKNQCGEGVSKQIVGNVIEKLHTELADNTFGGHVINNVD